MSINDPERKKILLLVDNDFDDAQLFEEALSEIDPSAIFRFAENGQDALDKLENENLEKPHIIFLDINMPVMDGWQCLTQLKKNEAYRNIPVIIYSTASYQREVDIAFDLGASCFYTKPKDYKHLKINLKIIADNLHRNLMEAIRNLAGIECRQYYPV